MGKMVKRGGLALWSVVSLWWCVWCAADPNIEMEYALQQGNLEGVRFALKNGADINRKGSGQQTPVMAATLQGHDALVRFFLTKKPNLDLAEQQNYTPIHGAGFQGRAAIAKMLIAHGMDPSHRHEDGYTPIHRACWGEEPRHSETVLAFLEAGVAPDEKAASGETPLQIATKTGNKGTITILNKALKDR